MAKRTSAPRQESAPGQEMSHAPAPPGEMSGLSKIEAEDVLDQLEAAGYDVCQLSFVDGQGFRVRPNAAAEKDNTELLAN